MTQRPTILVTNDDGIESPGLWASAEALLPLGEVIIVAPDRQWSGGGRAMPHSCKGRIQVASRHINGHFVTAYAVDASPALAVNHGVLELCPRRPALVVSGINSGANVSIEVTVSGTVGAALEGAAFGIPSLAVSLEMDANYHLTPNDAADYETAMLYIHRFGECLLQRALAEDVDVLNINVPAGARGLVPWRLTRLSRRRYFEPLAPDRSNGSGRPGYRLLQHPEETEPDSDIHALLVDKLVTVTPLSLDMTSRSTQPPADAKSEGLEHVLMCLPGEKQHEVATAVRA